MLDLETYTLDAARKVVAAFRDLEAKCGLDEISKQIISGPAVQLEEVISAGDNALPQMKVLDAAFITAKSRGGLVRKADRGLANAAAHLSNILNAAFITAPEATRRLRELEKALEPFVGLAANIPASHPDDTYVDMSISTTLTQEAMDSIEKIAGTRPTSPRADLVVSVDGVNAGHLRAIDLLFGR